jgi:uncharacterized membrane protein
MSVTAFGPLRRLPLRFPFGGVAAFLLGTLFLAGSVHICAILLVPIVAESDGWARLEPRAGRERFAAVAGSSEATGIPGLDPLFVTGLCRIDLDSAPARVLVGASERFWSLALFDSHGDIIFSLNDRTAMEGRLDMLVASDSRVARLREALAAQLDQAVVVESRSAELIALLRLYAPTPATRREAARALSEAICAPDERTALE